MADDVITTINNGWLLLPQSKQLININQIVTVRTFDLAYAEKYGIDVVLTNCNANAVLRYKDKSVRDEVFNSLIKQLMED